MQLFYDNAKDQLVMKCTGRFESDQLADLVCVDGLQIEDRMTLLIKDFRASGKNSFGAVKQSKINQIDPHIFVSGMSGSGRFDAGRNLIIEKLGGIFIGFDMQKYSIICNQQLIDNISQNNISDLVDNYRDMIRYISLDLLRVFEELTWPSTGRVCVDLHLPLLLRDLKYQDNSKIIYLFRDPRDWIVSTYQRFRNLYLRGMEGYNAPQCLEMYSKDGSDKTRVFKALIDGEFPYLSNGLFYVYPAVHQLLENRIEYKFKKNVFFVDYERTRLDPVPFFADFAKWLSDSDELPPELSIGDLEKAAEMGTFSYQTNGRFSEGQREEFLNDSCGWFRKGIVGDWKNHFTEELKEYFKERTGDLLVQAGYEKNMDW